MKCNRLSDGTSALWEQRQKTQTQTEADQPGPAQLVGVQSAPLPSPGLEVNTPALCQHPQVAREHGYQGLPADIQLEERLSPACQLEQ